MSRLIFENVQKPVLARPSIRRVGAGRESARGAVCRPAEELALRDRAHRPQLYPPVRMYTVAFGGLDDVKDISCLCKIRYRV